jgi:hypothetical protein
VKPLTRRPVLPACISLSCDSWNFKLAVLSLAVVGSAFASGCSAADDEAGTSIAEDELTAASDDFSKLTAALDSDLAIRVPTSMVGTRAVPSANHASSKDVCAALLGDGARGAAAAAEANRLPIFYAFAGAGTTAEAVVGYSPGTEIAWDLTHRQAAAFDSREVSTLVELNGSRDAGR